MECKLLYTKEPIVINPIAAEVLGVNEAIIVQQIHYWLNINEKAKINFHKGKYWTYNTYENWQKTNFRFLSVSTLKRIFKKLVTKGILITDNFNKAKYDRTLWVTINYEKLDELLSKYEEENKNEKSEEIEENVEISTKYQNDTMSNFNKVSKWNYGKYQVDTMESSKLTPPIPETNSETNSDICTTQNKSVVVENKNIELIENRTHLKAMSDNMKRKASKWNTERLDKAIDIFISKEGQYFSLSEKIYKDDKNFVPKVNTKSNNDPKFKTRFHNINERYNEYEPDELERLLRESQKDKFETSSIHKNYLIAISDGLKVLSIPMRKVIIEYAKENNLQIPN